MLRTGIRKIDIHKLYYWHNATLVGKYKLPQLKPNQLIPENVVSFNERNITSHPEEHWLDFFIDDPLFENFWNHPEVSFSVLRRYAGIITTDYSMMPEMLPGQMIWNCTRNRVMAFYLQSNEFKIIPVASWCGEEDFDWCFDGLPENSSIAVSTNGCNSSPYSERLFLTGIEELQQQKKPWKLIVCGREMNGLEKYDNILYYPSFSQRMQERIKNG